MGSDRIDKLYTWLWLAHEVGQLCDLSRWAVFGGGSIAFVWNAGIGCISGSARTVLGMCVAITGLCIVSLALSRLRVRLIDRIWCEIRLERTYDCLKGDL